MQAHLQAEMSYRIGYQDGAVQILRAVEQFLEPATLEVVRDWIEKDICPWRLNATRRYPSTWRLGCLPRTSNVAVGASRSDSNPSQDLQPNTGSGEVHLVDTKQGTGCPELASALSR